MVAPSLLLHPRNSAQAHPTENDMYRPLLIDVDTHPAMYNDGRHGDKTRGN
jgi:hypothetical protein